MEAGRLQDGASQSEEVDNRNNNQHWSSRQLTPTVKGVRYTVKVKPSDNEDKAVLKTTAQKIPHNFEAILEDANYFPMDKSSTEEKFGQLEAGILLNQK
ncbi:hypothetical protein FEM48_Zijuj01G0161400 [Ziziphus jujuba var. spinosa]|uniref:Uncharacterized protein n=1 Tax=Ziziphus jujuba var. spinosa TaxID=714518 RepID=A0A978W285_ZIZJJ|nr:hypothetical protein FEM48_Zijuj01G0161400 [Ziziphus jujuba var. spinosa]